MPAEATSKAIVPNRLSAKKQANLSHVSSDFVGGNKKTPDSPTAVMVRDASIAHHHWRPARPII